MIVGSNIIIITTNNEIYIMFQKVIYMYTCNCVSLLPLYARRYANGGGGVCVDVGGWEWVWL